MASRHYGFTVSDLACNAAREARIVAGGNNVDPNNGPDDPWFPTETHLEIRTTSREKDGKTDSDRGPDSVVYVAGS